MCIEKSALHIVGNVESSEVSRQQEDVICSPSFLKMSLNCILEGREETERGKTNYKALVRV